MKTNRLLIIGFVWPEPDSSAAGARMMQLIAFFQKSGYEITFASAAIESAHMADLRSIGVNCEKIELNNVSFDGFVTDLMPSVVLFDRFMTEEQFGWRITENCPDALRILDTEDLHCLRQARHVALKENREYSISDLFSDSAKREIASIWRSDVTLMISEVEMQLLQQVFNVDSRLLFYLPFLLEPITNENTAAWPRFNERNGFVFVGNFHHEPNRDAIRFLRETIWPLIRKQLPEAQMNVYGAYVPPVIAQLHKPELGFHIRGRAKIAADVVKEARVVLAPLRFGAGIKGKLTEAMICGTPSVTTSIGAESMHGTLDWNGLIADEPHFFANAAVELHQNEPAWAVASRNGIQIINARYSKQLFLGEFSLHLQTLATNLRQHRLQNFTGEMLRYHNLASTKYMSRWIEEKNRKAE